MYRSIMSTSPRVMVEELEAAARRVRAAMDRYDDLTCESLPDGRQAYFSEKVCADVTEVEAFAAKGNFTENAHVFVVPFADVDGLRVYARDRVQHLSSILMRARQKYPDQLRSFAQFLVSAQYL